MQFWIRHLVLLILCVVLPFSAALYFDTQREVDRAESAGLARAEQAAKSFKAVLELQARKRVTATLNLAQKVSILDNLEDLERTGARRETAYVELRQVLDAAVAGEPDSFAWYIDAEGNVLAASGAPTPAEDETFRSIVGHPAFIQTQEGYGLDALWSPDKPLTRIAMAPVTIDGAASGAVAFGAPVRKANLSGVADANITLVRGQGLELSSADEAVAKALISSGHINEAQPAFVGGRLDKPLPDASHLPFLPILLDRYANNRAHAGALLPVRGAPPELKWLVSVDAATGLGNVAERQEILLAGMLASLLLAVLVGLVNYRTFVKPLEAVEEHLSELQQGRGDLELPEARVSRPFRRLVRLINMTVQRMPMRTMPPISPPNFDLGLTGGSPSRDLTAPKLDTSDLDAPPPAAPPPVPVTAPESFGSAFPEMLPAGAVPDLTSPDASPRTDSADDDIAAAIASLESQSAEPTPVPRQASAIRGRMPQFTESPFSAGPGAATPGIRGGGSLDFDSQDLSQAAGTSDVPDDEFKHEATVVAQVQEDLLAQSARDDFTDTGPAFSDSDKPDLTVVASVPPDLLAQSATDDVKDNGPLAHLDLGDREHFKEVYDRFLDMRRKCGEKTADLAFERFMTKLSRNRENLIKKYSCRTVRFQVYEKDGKAALKATPVRAR